MYCSSCGVMVVQGLSYCNHCGARLTDEKGDHTIRSSEVRPESLVWGMVAVLVFGFVGIVFLMMAMKMVGLEVGQILALTILSFLIILLVEGVFIWQLSRRKREREKSIETESLKRPSTNELDAAQARMLREPCRA